MNHCTLRTLTNLLFLWISDDRNPLTLYGVVDLHRHLGFVFEWQVLLKVLGDGQWLEHFSLSLQTLEHNIEKDWLKEIGL